MGQTKLSHSHLRLYDVTNIFFLLPYSFSPFTEDEFLFLFIAFERFHIFGIFGYFLTLMEMTSLMTGFILNGLSESLLSSRLFRIKAWVLQVPFLSMIFLYFFDYSNLNHSKGFYLLFFFICIRPLGAHFCDNYSMFRFPSILDPITYPAPPYIYYVYIP